MFLIESFICHKINKLININTKKDIKMKKTKNIQKIKYKIWIITTLFFSIIAFIIFASVTIYIDPLFHYHKPLNKYKYPINN